MIKLMRKYLKTSVIPLLLIVVLLVVQAMGDLKLPDYTSDIVNVGIQQGGIKYAAPKTVREDSFNGIMSLVYDTTSDTQAVPTKVKKAEFDKILSFITTRDDLNYVKKSYTLKNGYYVLNNQDSSLSSKLADPISFFFVCDIAFKNPDMMEEMMNSADGSMDMSGVPKNLENIIDTIMNGTYTEKWNAITSLSMSTKKIVIDKVLSSGKIDSSALNTISYMWCAKNEKSVGNTDFGMSNAEKKIRSFYSYKNGVYTLKDTSDKNLELVESYIAQPITLYSLLETMAKDPDKFSEMMKTQSGETSTTELGFDFGSVDDKTMSVLYEALGLSKDASILDVMGMLPSSAKTQMVDGIKDKFGSLLDTLVGQYAVTWVKSEYKAQGLDMSKIQIDYLLKVGLQMLLVAAIIMLTACLVTAIAGRVAAKFGHDVRGDVFGKVIGFSGAEFNKFSTASLITRSTNDVQQMQMFIVMMLRMVLYAPIIAVGAVIKIFGVDGSLAWIIGAAVLLVIVTVVILFTVVSPKFEKMQTLVDRLNLVSREILTGLPVIRAFSTEDHERERFDNANKDFTKVNLFVNRTMALMMPLIMFIMSILSCSIIWFGAKKVDAGTMQVGNIMAYMQYGIQILMSFIMISMVSIFLPRARTSAKRVYEVVTTSSSVVDKEKPELFEQSKKGIVEFKNVDFSYPDSHENALSGIDFVAEPGKVTAIIGGTGSGKSTLVNLIPRFYDVTGGELLVDGKNVKNVDQHELRRIIGFVSQKAVLFSGTIDSNLRYGRREASTEDLEKAVEIAQAKEFVDAKAEKYEAPITQSGTNVSGGQKQRLAIARAIVKDPEVFVFDDSFSALDFKTDKTLRSELSKTTKDKTVIIVAQRISTIRNADKIIVLNDGMQVGNGTHEELMENCKEYREIALSQLSEEELKK